MGDDAVAGDICTIELKICSRQ